MDYTSSRIAIPVLFLSQIARSRQDLIQNPRKESPRDSCCSVKLISALHFDVSTYAKVLPLVFVDADTKTPSAYRSFCGSLLNPSN